MRVKLYLYLHLTWSRNDFWPVQQYDLAFLKKTKQKITTDTYGKQKFRQKETRNNFARKSRY